MSVRCVSLDGTGVDRNALSVLRQESGGGCGGVNRMQLVKCKECGRRVRSDADRCGVDGAAGVEGLTTLLGGRVLGCAQGVCVPFLGGFGARENRANSWQKGNLGSVAKTQG